MPLKVSLNKIKICFAFFPLPTTVNFNNNNHQGKETKETQRIKA
jgi:hypothetical protein